VEFVRWWRENVRRPGREGNNAALDYFSVENAEEQTGIVQPQVSKWGKRLADVPKYRAALRQPGRCRAAGHLMPAFRLASRGVSHGG
jgi:hypothetical protein